MLATLVAAVKTFRHTAASRLWDENVIGIDLTDSKDYLYLAKHVKQY